MKKMINDWRMSDDRFELRKLLMMGLIAEGQCLFPTVYDFCDFAISQGYGESYKCLSNTDRQEADKWIKARYEEWDAHLNS